MPTLKTRLSRSEEAEDRRCLREMYHEGVDVENPDDSPECAPALRVSIIAGLHTLIFNLPWGLAGYAIALRLVALRSGLILMEPQITTKTDDQIELEFVDLAGRLCKLGQCQYYKSEVLNDRFPLKLARDSMVEGVILATGLKPIPGQYRQGMIMPFTLTFWDQLGNPISVVDATLSVDRSTTPRQRLVRPKSSLRDPEEILQSREVSGGESPGLHTVLRATPDAKGPMAGKETKSERA